METTIMGYIWTTSDYHEGPCLHALLTDCQLQQIKNPALDTVEAPWTSRSASSASVEEIT